MYDVISDDTKSFDFENSDLGRGICALISIFVQTPTTDDDVSW
jgi:hypothetical protein